VAGGGVEGGVHREIRTVVRAFVGAGQTVCKARAVVNIGGEPGAERQVRREAGVQRIALIVIEGDVARASVAGGVSGDGAGKATDNVAALLCDLVGVGHVELAEMSELG